jgi:hypothetical protein
VSDRIDHELLDKFLQHILDRYKAGKTSQPEAIGSIAHLIAALDLPLGQGDDPTKYMTAVLAGDDDDD